MHSFSFPTSIEGVCFPAPWMRAGPQTCFGEWSINRNAKLMWAFIASCGFCVENGLMQGKWVGPLVIAVHVVESDQVLEMASMGSRQDWLVDWMWDVDRERGIKVIPGLGPELLEGWSCHLMLGRLWKEPGFVWRLFDFERIRFVVPTGPPRGGDD